MSALGPAQRRLAERLRELRSEGSAAPLTQSQVAASLKASVALVSSWENGNAVPPEARLRAYARAFATPSTFDNDHPHVVDEASLSDEERVVERRLVDELLTLRNEASSSGSPARGTGGLGGRFWHFPDGARIRIITTQMWADVLDSIPYADRRHPNFIESLYDADRDATIELFGHLRAENPTADVRFLTGGQVKQDDLTGHVVILGQGDLVWGPLKYFGSRLGLPVTVRFPEGVDREYAAEFVVTTDASGTPTWFPRDVSPPRIEVHRPRFIQDQSGKTFFIGDMPILEDDVALLARMPNPMNLSKTVTICTGVFSRGTYGAVRTLTDAHLRTSNEAFLMEHFGSFDNFWILLHVPVAGMRDPGDEELAALETFTPDLRRPFHRLRLSS